MNKTNVDAFIVDDEDICILSTELNLKKYCPEVRVTGKFSNPIEALAAAKISTPDIVFLDINMVEMNGIELAKELNLLFIHTVFISSYDQFALPALKISAADFLLKPIDPIELTTTVRRITTINKSKSDKLNLMVEGFSDLVQNQKRTNNKIVALPRLSEITITNIELILYCEGMGNYTKVFFKDGFDVLLSKTLAVVERQFDSTIFIRIHNKYMINIHYVCKMVRNDGAGIIIMENGTKLPLSKSRRKDFLNKFAVL